MRKDGVAAGKLELHGQSIEKESLRFVVNFRVDGNESPTGKK